jgi:O-antigen/teichoic acid export membrane protein
MKKTYVRISKQIAFSYASTILLFLVTPLLVFLLTRTLSIAQYGIYSVLAVTVNVAGVLLDLGLSQYIMSRLAGIAPQARAKAFFTLSTFLMVFVIAVIAAVLFTPLQSIILGMLRLTEYAAEFKIGLAIILCVTLIRLFTAYLTAKKHVVLVNIIFFISQSLWVMLLFAAYAYTRTLSLLTVMTSWFAGVLVTLLVCFWLIRREFAHWHRSSSWSPEAIREGLLFSLPLLFFITGSWAIEIGDRYLLNGMLGSEAVGLYTLIYSLLGVIASLGTIVSQTFFPYIAAAWNQKQNYRIYLNAALKYSLVVIIPAMVGFFVLRTQIVTLVSGEKYLEAANIIPGLLLYPLLSALNFILYQIVLLRRRTMLIGGTYAVGAVINIGLNLFLIPRFSMTGAAIATVISYAFVFVVLAYDARKAVRVDVRFLKLGRILAASALMGVGVWLANPYTVWAKIATMAAGAIVYFGLIFLFGVFSKQERELLGSVLPPQLRKLVPGLSS